MTDVHTLPARWYVVSRDGLATLCVDEAEAKRYAPECDRMYKHAAPHRAVQLGDVAATVEACAAVCDRRSDGHWSDYKDPTSPRRADQRAEAASDEAEQCGQAIRAHFGGIEP